MKAKVIDGGSTPLALRLRSMLQGNGRNCHQTPSEWCRERRHDCEVEVVLALSVSGWDDGKLSSS